MPEFPHFVDEHDKVSTLDLIRQFHQLRIPSHAPSCPEQTEQPGLMSVIEIYHQSSRDDDSLTSSTLRTWERRRGGGGAGGVRPPTSPPSRLLNPPSRERAYYLCGELGVKQVVLVRLFASIIGFDGGEHHRVERINSVAEGGSALVQKVAYFNG